MMFSLSLIAAICSTAVAAPILENRATTFPYGSEMIRGVNLGGWLVLEPWITPSLWNGFNPDDASSPVDEYHLMQAWGPSKAKTMMQQHWATWYTESDFQKIAAAGLNMVRIPIGYWAFHLNSGDPYLQGQEAYLDKAISWARATGLKVWIDLHGAPGSQNGFDNSGFRGPINFQQGNNVATTLQVLKTISNKYAKSSYSDVVIGIELLNEPLGPNLDMGGLTQFYKDGFGQVRSVGNQVVVIEDAFQNPSYWNGIFSESNANVAVDHHHYQVFSPAQVGQTPEQQVQAACASVSETSGSNKWVIVGEFSSAMTDCAVWLNGYGRGSRYEGQYDNSPRYGSCANKNDLRKWTAQDKVNTRKFIEAQLDTFEKAQGWIYWTWKAEASAEWDLSWQLAEGVFPHPVTSRQYPGQCN